MEASKKMNNRKHISLLVTITMLIAYAVPFCIGVFADSDTVWTFTDAPAGVMLTNNNGAEKEWYIKTTDLGNGLTAYATDALNSEKQEYSSAFEVDRKSKTKFTVNGEEEEVAGALKFGGKSSTSARYLTYTPSSDGTLTAYVKHGSPSKANTDVRSLIIKQGENSKTISTIGTDNPYITDSFQVIAGTDIMITCDNNVALAKLVFASGGEVPEESSAPEESTIPAETKTPAATATVPVITENPVKTEAPVTTSPTPVVTQKPVVTTPTPVVTPSPAAPVVSIDPTDPDMAAVLEDAEKLQLNAVSQTAIYFDIDLDKSGANGSSITWESSNTEYIDIQMVSSIKRNYTGVVTRPREEECDESGGVPVTLTATLKKGKAEYKKEFNVSVRKWNPMYYNDFQDDVGKSAEGTYQEIADNVTAADGKSTFRGIRVDTLKESRAFEAFGHGDKDTPQYFDKRIMSTDAVYGKPQGNSEDEENFAFYYNMYKAYGGSTTYNPLWIKLIDPETGTAPEGIVMLSMDIQPITTGGRFNMGFGTSKASQMCRFLLYNGEGKLGYPSGGLLRTFNGESAVDFMGGKNGYCYPTGKWSRAVLVANSESHLWDFYFEGMQVAKGLSFRNAEDKIPTIEFTMDRSMGGAFLIDNIYVENMTEDYKDTYWDAFDLSTLPYDSAQEAYVADKSFLLQYQGTDGLSGKYFTWKSSNAELLSVSTVRIPIEELLNYGYTEEQIKAYKENGVEDVSVVVAKPGTVEKDTYVTLTAKLEVGNTVNKKDFKILLKKNIGTNVGSDSEKAIQDANAISCIKNGEIITSDVMMDKKGSVNGSEITWKSSNSSVFAPDGSVTRPSSNSIKVTLTAAVKYGEAIEYRTFNVTVSAKNSGSSGGGGGGGGGTSSSSKSSTPISIAGESKPVPADNISDINKDDRPFLGAPAFTDLSQAEWAKEAIEYLYSKDIVNGYGNGLYGVNDNVTREQFVRMLLTALNIKLVLNEDSEFNDVEADSWYANYVNAALKLGIVTGLSENEFGVGQPISRQDMSVMCMRALDFVNSNADSEIKATEAPGIENTAEPSEEPAQTASPEATEAPEATAMPKATSEPEPEQEEKTLNTSKIFQGMPFGDNDEISDYAAEAVAVMTAAGYLQGDENGNFAPQKSLTRAETAVVLYRIIK